MEDVQNFIDKDPYTEDGLIMFDVTKPKVKVLHLRSKKYKDPLEVAIKEEKKKKRGKKKKEKKEEETRTVLHLRRKKK